MKQEILKKKKKKKKKKRTLFQHAKNHKCIKYTVITRLSKWVMS